MNMILLRLYNIFSDGPFGWHASGGLKLYLHMSMYANRRLERSTRGANWDASASDFDPKPKRLKWALMTNLAFPKACLCAAADLDQGYYTLV